MDKIFKIELSEQELRIVGDALLELPAKITINVINNINEQINQILAEE